MALVMNASSREQTVQVHGAWFTFAPGQIKTMNEDKVFFLSSTKGYMGFVSVPEKFEDLDARSTPEGKKELEQIREQGVSNRIRHLEWLRHNELKSLRQDMDKKNIKAATETEMTSESFGVLEDALKELKGYKSKAKDSVRERRDRLKELSAGLDEALTDDNEV